MPVLIMIIVFGSLTAVLLGMRYMKHIERLAEIEARKAQALAQLAEKGILPPDPKEAEREALAKELLAAYDEAGKLGR